MTDVSKRLKEERRKARYSSTEFAELGGVKVKTQWSYELGRTAPNTNYLTAVSRVVDINYIVSGSRAGGAFVKRTVPPKASLVGLDKEVHRQALIITDTLLQRFDVPESYRHNWPAFIYALLVTSMVGFTNKQVIDYFGELLREREQDIPKHGFVKRTPKRR